MQNFKNKSLKAISDTNNTAPNPCEDGAVSHIYVKQPKSSGKVTRQLRYLFLHVKGIRLRVLKDMYPIPAKLSCFLHPLLYYTQVITSCYKELSKILFPLNLISL